MSNSLKNERLVCVGKESAYGTEQTTPTNKFAFLLNCERTINKTTAKQKTGSPEPKQATNIATTSDYKLTLSGDWCHEAALFYESFTNKSSTPYTIQKGTRPSYTFYHAQPESSSDLGDGDIITGAKFDSLSFSNEDGKIGFEMTFIAKLKKEWQSLAGIVLTGITDTSMPEYEPFMWVDSDINILGVFGSALDFSLSLNAVRIPEEASYQNNRTRIIDAICQITGTLSGTVVYDTDESVIIYADGFADGGITLALKQASGTNTHTITMNGQIEMQRGADDTECQYDAPFEMMIGGTDSASAISIVVA